MTLKRFKKAAPPRSGEDQADEPELISPNNAWRILCRATGGDVGRATFYRWLSSGRLYSIRLGFRIFIPWPALEQLIRQCKAGDRFGETSE